MPRKHRKIAAAFIRRTSGGFTLVELMVVILIVGILAAASVPLMRGRGEKVKWSEANASCGTIWLGVRSYIAEKGPNHDYSDVKGKLDAASVRNKLGFGLADLAGTYFDQGNYEITAVDGSEATGPGCTIIVTSPADKGPHGGPGTLTATKGYVSWTVTGM